MCSAGYHGYGPGYGHYSSYGHMPAYGAPGYGPGYGPGPGYGAPYGPHPHYIEADVADDALRPRSTEFAGVLLVVALAVALVRSRAAAARNTLL